jgi:hypothetical protein
MNLGLLFLIIFLLVVILVAAVLWYARNKKRNIHGGAPLPLIDMTPFPILVFDGHNLTHTIMNSMKISNFKEAVEETIKRCDRVSKRLGASETHIVFKTHRGPGGLNMISDSTYRELSKKYKNIWFDIAKGADEHAKARDDFLTLYLGFNGYVISNDKYRDIENFKRISQFRHIQFYNGKIYELKIIDPEGLFHKLSKQAKGDRLRYKFGNENIVGPYQKDGELFIYI